MDNSTPFNSKSKVSVWDIVNRDGWFCSYCGDAIQRGYMTLDHVTPTSRGGADVLSNVVLSCLQCNVQKGDMTLDEYRHWRAVVRYVFDIAPYEIIEYGVMAIKIPYSDRETVLAPVALWMGTAFIDNEFKSIIESGGAIVVHMARGDEKSDVVFMRGPLFDYYQMKRGS